ncbi:MAG: hypothetical protein IMW99_05910 [Firmicutes bacterium]|nr:hypothetical protein [Bacillota bacterium]
MTQGWIDLHCHLLPGVDDGAPDLPSALELARQLVDQGVDRVAATVHLLDGRTPQGFTPDQIAGKRQYLQEELNRAAIPLTVLPGSEVWLTPAFLRPSGPERIYLGRGSGGPLSPAPGAAGLSYLLVEFDLYQEEPPAFLDEVLFELSVSGVVPVIAHPERYAAVRRHPGRVDQWLEKGAVLQINAGSLLGHGGPQAQALAIDWLAAGKIHLLASDAHHPQTRSVRLAEAVEAAAAVVGQAGALRLVRENPQLLLEGRELLPALAPSAGGVKVARKVKKGKRFLQ